MEDPQRQFFWDLTIPLLHTDLRQMIFEFCSNCKQTFFTWRLINSEWHRATRSLQLIWAGGPKMDEKVIKTKIIFKRINIYLSNRESKYCHSSFLIISSRWIYLVATK